MTKQEPGDGNDTGSPDNHAGQAAMKGGRAIVSIAPVILESMTSYLASVPDRELGGILWGLASDPARKVLGAVFPGKQVSQRAYCEFDGSMIASVNTCIRVATAMEIDLDSWADGGRDGASVTLKGPEIQGGAATARIIGWVHSHPGFGIFLSSTDRNTFQNWARFDPGAAALVIDPRSRDHGFFGRGMERLDEDGSADNAGVPRIASCMDAALESFGKRTSRDFVHVGGDGACSVRMALACRKFRTVFPRSDTLCEFSASASMCIAASEPGKVQIQPAVSAAVPVTLPSDGGGAMGAGDIDESSLPGIGSLSGSQRRYWARRMREEAGTKGSTLKGYLASFSPGPADLDEYARRFMDF